jgi:hypothetical protein
MKQITGDLENEVQIFIDHKQSQIKRNAQSKQNLAQYLRVIFCFFKVQANHIIDSDAAQNDPQIGNIEISIKENRTTNQPDLRPNISLQTIERKITQ